MRTWLVVLSCFLSVGSHAAGFMVAEQGARATGVANAATASGADGSAIYYNPAAITALKGVQAYVGLNLIAPRAQLTGGGSGETIEADARNFFTPTVYLTYQASEFLTLGLGVYAPFGLGITWPETSPGRAIVRSQDLTTVFVSPVVAANLDKWAPGLSVAVGIDVVPAVVELSRDIVFGGTVGDAQLSGHALGVGGRVGLFWESPLVRGLSVGLAWKSPVKLGFAGEGDFDIDPIFRASVPPDGEISTQLTLPHSLSFGVAYQALPQLTVEVDLNWVGWSSYDQLVFDFADGSQSRAAKDWHDTVTVRAGVEYVLGMLALRGGYAFDQSPVPAERLDPTLPDGDRHVATLGVGLELSEQIKVDAGVLWVLPFSRATSDEPHEPLIKGTYDVSAWVASLSVGFAFAHPTPAPSADDAKTPPATRDVPTREAPEIEEPAAETTEQAEPTEPTETTETTETTEQAEPTEQAAQPTERAETTEPKVEPATPGDAEAP